MRPTTATIKRECPRYADWVRVFGTGTIQIMAPITHQASAPGIESGEFYRLHVPSLTAEQRARLVEFISERFGEVPEIVNEMIDDPELGVPILADDVIVCFDARAAL